MAGKNLTVAHLKTLLTRIGSPTSGKRLVLAARLTQDLCIPRLPLSSKNATKQSTSRWGPREEYEKSARILSIDMGIRNLAFCVADASIESSFGQPEEGRSTSDSEARQAEAKVKTIAWRRVDVMHEAAEANARHQLPIADHSRAQDRLDTESSLEDPFHPRVLAHTAYTLLTRVLLPYKPDIILIERQRYRSGGGAAIQEWTVRVNMLEGMLWAVLEALRGETPKPPSPSNAKDAGFPKVFDVSPARVGTFWIDSADQKHRSGRSTSSTQAFELGPEGEVTKKAGGSTTTSRKISRGKVEKKAKIQLVRSWLSNAPFSSAVARAGKGKKSLQDYNAPIMFSFTPEAEKTRKALCLTASRAKRSKNLSDETEKMGNVHKFDDLADCFLQAAAWVAWEWNRMEIQQEGMESILHSRISDGEDKSTATKKKTRTAKKNIKRGKARSQGT